METLDESYRRAEEEELRGDALFFAGAAGAGAHYRAAQHALFPPGLRLEDAAENERRMALFGRLTQKLYEIGGDGRRRGSTDPVREPEPARTEPEPEPEPESRVLQEAAYEERPEPEPAPVIASARAVTQRSRYEEELAPTPLARLFGTDDHWGQYHLGQKWFAAAQHLADKYPGEAEQACRWSAYHFGNYNAEWSAHLPASRWDSDGIGEQEDAERLRASLPAADPDVVAPQWIRRLAAGDWRGALQTAPELAEGGEWEPLRRILAAIQARS